MSLISENMKNVPPSMIFAIGAKVRELRAKGIKVFDLSVGEPECPTPQHVKEAAYNAIKANKTKYTAAEGILELRQAVCNKYNKRIGRNFTPDQVVVSNGAKQVLYNCFAATLNKGEEVIVPAPYWVSYTAAIKLCGGKPVIIQCAEETNFKASIANIERAITNQTKWLLINSPNNPTGVKYSREELAEIAALLKKYPNLYILSDDIYEELSFDNAVCSMIDVVPEAADRMLIVNGVSKAYAMTGWRIGYGLGPKELIKAMGTIQSQSTSGPCSVSQYAALEALNGSQQSVSDYVQVLKKRRDIAYKFFNELLGCPYPVGAFYIFPNCSKFIGRRSPNGNDINSDIDFCHYLLEESRVIVTPGQPFGASGYFRLSYAVADEDLHVALDGIKASISKLG